MLARLPEVLDKKDFLLTFKSTHKLTHSRIAQLCGVSENTVQRWFGAYHRSNAPTAASCKLMWLLDYCEKNRIELPEIPDFE